MLTQTAPKDLELSSTQKLARNARKLASRRIWLPRVLYDCLPYFYLTAGFAAFYATLYISDWFWVLPHYILFCAACLHLALAVYRRRKRPRRRDTDQSGTTASG